MALRFGDDALRCDASNQEIALHRLRFGQAGGPDAAGRDEQAIGMVLRPVQRALDAAVECGAQPPILPDRRAEDDGIIFHEAARSQDAAAIRRFGETMPGSAVDSTASAAGLSGMHVYTQN